MADLEHLDQKACILISIVAALLGCVADVLLLYEPNAVYENGDYQFLLDISQRRLLLGSVLGVVSIPVYLCGIYVLSARLVRNKTHAFASLMACVVIAVIGCVYHASIPLVGYILKASDEPVSEIERIRVYVDLYAAGLAVSFFACCLGFGCLMSAQRQWLLLACNPMCTYCVCLLCYLLLPQLGRIVLPAAFNLSIAVLMAAVLHLLSDEDNRETRASKRL